MTMMDKNRVTRIRLMQPKKTSATLFKRTGGDTFDDGTAYANVYFPPKSVESGITSDGVPNHPNTLFMYQEGEAETPAIDDKVIDADGNLYLVLTVTSSLNFTANWGVHKLSIVGVT